jgi:hypothetical protein
MLILRRSKLYSQPVNCTAADRDHSFNFRVTIPDDVTIQFRPPEDEHSIARNMSRIVM